MPDNELVIYRVLKGRGKIPGVTYREYSDAARRVTTAIPPEEVLSIEELLRRLEEVLKR
jgi:hypothetical protein